MLFFYILYIISVLFWKEVDMFNPKEIMENFNKKFEEGHFQKDILPNKGPDFTDKDFTTKKVEAFKKLLNLEIFSKISFN